MTFIELARLVQAMRSAQKAYFAARRRGEAATGELEASRRHEREIDGICNAILNPRPLFDRSDDG